MTGELLPTAVYTFDDDETASKTIGVENQDFSKLSTQGKTNGPSEYLVNSSPDWVDRDVPSEPTNSEYGKLRAYLTQLQDDVNGFLTERMKKAKESK